LAARTGQDLSGAVEKPETMMLLNFSQNAFFPKAAVHRFCTPL
jgi:hypothetical protein